jgi:hypothetical protein
MIETKARNRFFATALLLTAIALGCSSNKGGTPAPSRQSALATSNGLFQNGLTSNGLFQNGLFQNGLFQNGLFQNGLFQNGLFQNGLFQNGLFQNGLFQNGLWQGGFFSNSAWAKGLTGDAAFLGNTLRSSPYARQLLQYIYACAMPPTTYDASLDPNGGTLSCSSTQACDFGYECNSSNVCVVPLRGNIGVGINADETSWGASGKCDETCQRWVSACVLARTNAYGVHVEISMRAPADAPQAIKDALAVSDLERNGDASNVPYNLREGAYYGNIFAMAPLNPPPSPTYSGPVLGPIVSAPSFNACAGPGSNIPEITKRFCSSQGDQVIINVAGTCLATTTAAGVCAGEDTDPTSPTYGAIQDCGGYSQVITVYLKQPIAVCGNAVCETGETTTSCPSDCLPGWAKDFDASDGIGGGAVNVLSSNIQNPRMSAVTPDNGVVVLGRTFGDVDLGGGALPVSGGFGLLAKYTADGSYAWGLRLQPDQTPPSPTDHFSWDISGGLTVDPAGHITVVGLWVRDPNAPNIGYTPPQSIWMSTFSTDGMPLASYSVPTTDISSTTFPHVPNSIQYTSSLGLGSFGSHGVTTDSQGNVLIATGFCGSMQFPATAGGLITLTGQPCQGTGAANWGFVVMKLVPPAPGASEGTVQWVQLLSTGNFPLAGWGTLSFDVDPSTDDLVVLTEASGAKLFKLSGVDGHQLWTKPASTTPYYAQDTVATFGRGSGPQDIYVGGYLGAGADLGCPSGPVAPMNGIVPFIERISGVNGNCVWVKYPNVVCPPGMSTCGGSMPGNQSALVQGDAISFDPSGNVIFGTFGNPVVGGGIDFGVGTFPMYSSNNIFVSAYGPTDGHTIWAKQIPTILSSALVGMDIDNGGHIVVSGNFSGSMEVNNRLLQTGVPEDPRVVDAFVASFGGPSPSDITPPQIGATIGPPDQPPVFTVPKNIVAQATSAAGANVFFMLPTAVDTGNAGTSVACSPPPNTTFPMGVDTVTCTASDPRGNKSSASFTVTVADTLAPLLSPTADITLNSPTGQGLVVTYPLTAIDQVDGPMTPSCNHDSGSLFPTGKTTVTCTAKDRANNVATTSFVVTITAPPTVTVPANITAEATSSAGAAVTFSASAKDWQGNPLTPTCTATSGSTFALGSTTVTCTATDAYGQGSASFTVTVADTQPPVFAGVPGTITAYATSTAGALVSYTLPTAVDVVDGVRPVSCSPPSGAFPVNQSTVTCTSSDTHGNTATVTFTVWVTYQAPTDGSFFMQPINPDGSSIFKRGSTVPVKFALTGASAGIGNLVAKLYLAKVSNTIEGSYLEAVSNGASDSGNTFRYDPQAQQYVFNLSTTALATGTWSLRVDLGDGVVHQVNVSLR